MTIARILKTQFFNEGTSFKMHIKITFSPNKLKF